jgi:hypothetical protein
VSRIPAARAASTQVARWESELELGQDFSVAPEHDDDLASTLADAVSARTSGWDEDEEMDWYRPSASGGSRLLAHEVAHVIQQR